MNKLRDKFDKLFEPDFLKITGAEYYDGDEIGDAIWDWINQNYISKQQILNLECLKEEEPDEFDDFIGTDRIETKNKLRKEIKEEITKDLFKDFKQVSNPLDPYEKP